MRSTVLIASAALVGACSEAPERGLPAHVLSQPVIRIVEASSQIYLDSIHLMDPGSSPSRNLERAIQIMVGDFYFNQCAGDSAETFCRMADALLFTLRIQGRKGDYYLMLLQHVPQGFVTARLVKWDARDEIVMGGSVDLPLSAMYNVKHGRLARSNLSDVFKLTGPQFAVLDTLGEEAVAIQRLWHNGTFSALDRTVLCIDHGELDTLATSFTVLPSGLIIR